MKTRRLRQVYVAAADLERQVAFFRDVLGLEFQFRDGDRWAQFRAGDVSLALASASEAQGAPPGAAVPVFEVEDLEGARAEALAAGCDTGEVRDMGEHKRTVALVEPSGTRLVLFERRS